MSLWADYCKEKEGMETVENENGFLSYKIFDKTKECFIAEFYVRPEARASHLAKDLLIEVSKIGKSKGCVDLTVQISTEHKNIDRMLRAYIVNGFKFYKADTSRLCFIKEL